METIGNNLQEAIKKINLRKKQQPTSLEKDTQQEKEENYKCPICKDLTYIVDFKENMAYECSCKKKRKIERLMKSSNMSKEFQSKTFKAFNPNWLEDERIYNAFKIAVEYAKGFNDIKDTSNNSLGLVGASGSGKSHLTSAVGNYLMKNGIEVVYFNFVNGFKEMFASYDREDGKAKVQEIREMLHNAEVLIIDDIGKGRPDVNKGFPLVSKAVYDEMYGLIEARYYKNKPIIYSSEYFYELIEMLGEATASRLFERSKGHIAKILYQSGEQTGLLNYRLRDI